MVDFWHVTDPADPDCRNLSFRIFSALFTGLPDAQMLPDLQKHIRYPEDLFNIQALQYRAFHMDAPEVFYNREDLWQFPREASHPRRVEPRRRKPDGALLHHDALAR